MEARGGSPSPSRASSQTRLGVALDQVKHTCVVDVNAEAKKLWIDILILKISSTLVYNSDSLFITIWGKGTARILGGRSPVFRNKGR